MSFPETQAAASSPSPTAWRGGRTGKTRAGAGLKDAGPSTHSSGPESSASATILLSPPQPQHEATAGQGLFQHKRRRVHAGKPTVTLALAAGDTVVPTAEASLPDTSRTAPGD